MKSKFWPLILSSIIKPPFEKVRTATPSLYSGDALAPSVINAVLSEAPNSKLSYLNLSRSFLALKKIIWLKAWPPYFRPIDNLATEVEPITSSFSKTSPFFLAPPIRIPSLLIFTKKQNLLLLL